MWWGVRLRRGILGRGEKRWSASMDFLVVVDEFVMQR